MADQEFIYNVAEELTLNNFVRTGYSFTNWATKADGSGFAYEDKESVTNLAGNGITTLYAVWKANEYTVTLIDEDSSKEETYTYTYDSNKINTTFANAGYNLSWADVDGNKVEDFNAFVIAKTDAEEALELYAVWTPHTNTQYKVEVYLQNLNDNYVLSETKTYNNGTSGSSLTITLNVTEGDTVGEKILTDIEGFTLNTEQSELTKTVNGDGSTVFKAYFTRNKYQVTVYDKEGEVVSSLSEEYKYAANVSLSTSAIKHTGYAFNGYVSEDVTFTINQTSGNYEFNMPASAVEITTNWTARTFNVVLNKNNATGSVTTPVSLTYDSESASLPKGSIAITGHTFKEWNTQANGEGVAYGTTINKEQVNSLFNNGAGTTLYAIFTANEFTVTFNANGGTGTMANQTFVYGTSENLTKNNFKKNGYVFKEWSYTINSSPKTIADGVDGSTITTVDGATVELKATWEKEVFDVTYNANNGTDEVDVVNDLLTYDTANATGLGGNKEFTKRGYVFTGWSLTADNKNVISTLDVDTVNAIYNNNKTVYAVWTPEEITITFVYDNGQANGEETYYYNGSEQTFAEPTKTGYNFEGWVLDLEGVEVPSKEISVDSLYDETVSTEITIYAVWSKDTIVVVYNANNNTGNTEQGLTLTYDTANDTGLATTTEFIKTGYTFVGWSLNSGVNNDAVIEELDVATVNNIYLQDGNVYAVWQANTYTVTFHANGGTGTQMPAQSFTYDEAEKALSTNTYTKEGYHFKAWNTESDGSGDKTYNDKHLVQNLTSEADGNINLYVVWEADLNTPYIVEIYQQDLNGNYPETATSTIDKTGTTGDKATYTASTIAGFTYDSANPNNVLEGTIAPDGSLVLKVYYTRNDVKVTLTKQNGIATFTLTANSTLSSSENVYTIKYGATITLAYTMAEVGYTFAGLYNGATEVVASQGAYVVENVTANATIEARTTENKYTIVFDKNHADANFAEGVQTTIENVAFTTNFALLTKDNVSRNGYNLVGWTLNASNEGSVYSVGANTNAQALLSAESPTITFYAKWQADTFKVTYNNGLSGENAQTKVSAEFTYPNFTLATSDPFDTKRTGYTLIGWSIDNDGSVDTIAVDDLYTTNDSKVIYAVWEANEYTFTIIDSVTHTSIDIESKGYEVKYKTDDVVSLTDSDFAKTGYTFTSFDTEDVSISGTGTRTFTMPAKNVTLTAIYTENQYTITFNGNNATGGSTSSIENVLYTQEVTLGNGFSKEGYTFIGWATTEGATEAEYNATAKYSGLSATNGDTVTLYAVWSIDSYKVILTNNVNDDQVEFGTFEYNQEVSVTTDAVNEKGTIFGYTLNAIAETFNMPSQDKVIALTYTPKTYRISYSFEGEEVHTQEIPYNQLSSTTLDNNTFTNEGFNFVGWKTASDDSGQKVAANATAKEVFELFDSELKNESITLYPDWADGYVVYVDGVSQGSQTAGETITINDPTRTGFTFNGYVLADDDTSGVELTDGQGVTTFTMPDDSDVRIKSTWTANTFKVIYNSNYDGGAENQISADLTYSETAQAELPTNVFTRLGYTLIGWSNIENGDIAKTLYLKDLYTEDNSKVIYAVWKAHEIIINLVWNDDENRTSAIEGGVYYDEIEQDIGTAGYWGASKTGYNFEGWTSEVDGLVDSSLDTLNGVYETLYESTEPNEDGVYVFTIYAIWEADQFSVTYNNGLSGDDAKTETSATFTYPNFTLATAENAPFERTGYTLKGWSLANDGSVDTLTIDKLYTTDDSKVIYAVWQPNTFTVTFNANGGTGEMEDQTFSYGITQGLSNNTFERTGYKFLFWDIDPNGSEYSYFEGMNGSHLSSTNNDTITLYAIWTEITFTVYFDGYPTPTNATYNDTGFSISSGIVSKEGYKLDGWATVQEPGQDDSIYPASGYLTKDQVNEIFLSCLVDEGGNYSVTLYPVWSLAEFAVVFVDKNTTPETTTITKGYDYNESVTLTAGTVTGYTFSQFVLVNEVTAEELGLTADDLKNNSITFNMPAKDIVIHAEFTPNTYRVVFDGNGADGGEAPEEMTFIYGEAQSLPEVSFTKTGYEIREGEGWCPERVPNYSEFPHVPGEAIYISQILEDFGLPEGNYDNCVEPIILYATWTAITFNVTYNANGGTGTDANSTSLTYDYSGTPLATSTNYTKTGYTFKGWSLTAGDYESQTIIPTGTLSAETVNAIYANNKTVYAVWQVNTYTVTVKDGTEVKATYEVNYGETATITNLTKTGYTFEGFTVTLPENSSLILTTGETNTTFTMIAENVTLSANWDAIAYNLTVDGEDLGTVEFGQTASFTAPTNDGHSLSGFTVKVAGAESTSVVPTLNQTSGKYEFTMPAGDVEITTVWEVISYRYTVVTDTDVTSKEGTEDYNSEVEIVWTDLTTKLGYHITGLSSTDVTVTNADGKSTFTMPANDVELEIVYTANTYTVTFNANTDDINGETLKANVTGSMSNQSFTYDVTQQLTTNGFTCTGYDFKGWNTQSDGSGDPYSNKAQVNIATTEDGATVTLYAQWEEKMISVFTVYWLQTADSINTYDVATTIDTSTASISSDAKKVENDIYTIEVDQEFSSGVINQNGELQCGVKYYTTYEQLFDLVTVTPNTGYVFVGYFSDIANNMSSSDNIWTTGKADNNATVGNAQIGATLHLLFVEKAYDIEFVPMSPLVDADNPTMYNTNYYMDLYEAYGYTIGGEEYKNSSYTDINGTQNKGYFINQSVAPLVSDDNPINNGFLLNAGSGLDEVMFVYPDDEDVLQSGRSEMDANNLVVSTEVGHDNVASKYYIAFDRNNVTLTSSLYIIIDSVEGYANDVDFINELGLKVKMGEYKVDYVANHSGEMELSVLFGSNVSIDVLDKDGNILNTRPPYGSYGYYNGEWLTSLKDISISSTEILDLEVNVEVPGEEFEVQTIRYYANTLYELTMSDTSPYQVQVDGTFIGDSEVGYIHSEKTDILVEGTYKKLRFDKNEITDTTSYSHQFKHWRFTYTDEDAQEHTVVLTEDNCEQYGIELLGIVDGYHQINYYGGKGYSNVIISAVTAPVLIIDSINVNIYPEDAGSVEDIVTFDDKFVANTEEYAALYGENVSGWLYNSVSINLSANAPGNTTVTWTTTTPGFIENTNYFVDINRVYFMQDDFVEQGIIDADFTVILEAVSYDVTVHNYYQGATSATELGPIAEGTTGGSVSGLEGNVTVGEQYTFTVSPESNYKFDGLYAVKTETDGTITLGDKVNIVYDGTKGEYTWTAGGVANPSSGLHLYALFVTDSMTRTELQAQVDTTVYGYYSISAGELCANEDVVQGLGGTITICDSDGNAYGSDVTTFYVGQTIKLLPVADEAYVFVSWLAQDETWSTYAIGYDYIDPEITTQEVTIGNIEHRAMFQERFVSAPIGYLFRSFSVYAGDLFPHNHGPVKLYFSDHEIVDENDSSQVLFIFTPNHTLLYDGQNSGYYRYDDNVEQEKQYKEDHKIEISIEIGDGYEKTHDISDWVFYDLIQHECENLEYLQYIGDSLIGKEGFTVDVAEDKNSATLVIDDASYVGNGIAIWIDPAEITDVIDPNDENVYKQVIEFQDGSFKQTGYVLGTEYGSVTMSPAYGEKYYYTMPVTLTVTPTEGYHLNVWLASPTDINDSAAMPLNGTLGTEIIGAYELSQDGNSITIQDASYAKYVFALFIPQSVSITVSAYYVQLPSSPLTLAEGQYSECPDSGRITSYNVYYGNDISLLETDNNPAYEFAGWYKDSAFTELISTDIDYFSNQPGTHTVYGLLTPVKKYLTIDIGTGATIEGTSNWTYSDGKLTIGCYNMPNGLADMEEKIVSDLALPSVTTADGDILADVYVIDNYNSARVYLSTSPSAFYGNAIIVNASNTSLTVEVTPEYYTKFVIDAYRQNFAHFCSSQPSDFEPIDIEATEDLFYFLGIRDKNGSDITSSCIMRVEDGDIVIYISEAHLEDGAQISSKGTTDIENPYQYVYVGKTLDVNITSNYQGVNISSSDTALYALFQPQMTSVSNLSARHAEFSDKAGGYIQGLDANGYGGLFTIYIRDYNEQEFKVLKSDASVDNIPMLKGVEFKIEFTAEGLYETYGILKNYNPTSNDNLFSVVNTSNYYAIDTDKLSSGQSFDQKVGQETIVVYLQEGSYSDADYIYNPTEDGFVQYSQTYLNLDFLSRGIEQTVTFDINNQYYIDLQGNVQTQSGVNSITLEESIDDIFTTTYTMRYGILKQFPLDFNKYEAQYFEYIGFASSANSNGVNIDGLVYDGYIHQFIIDQITTGVITPVSEEDPTTLKLYAIWKQVPYYISYYDADGNLLDADTFARFDAETTETSQVTTDFKSAVEYSYYLYESHENRSSIDKVVVTVIQSESTLTERVEVYVLGAKIEVVGLTGNEKIVFSESGQLAVAYGSSTMSNLEFTGTTSASSAFYIDLGGDYLAEAIISDSKFNELTADVIFTSSGNSGPSFKVQDTTFDNCTTGTSEGVGSIVTVFADGDALNIYFDNVSIQNHNCLGKAMFYNSYLATFNFYNCEIGSETAPVTSENEDFLGVFVMATIEENLNDNYLFINTDTSGNAINVIGEETKIYVATGISAIYLEGGYGACVNAEIVEVDLSASTETTTTTFAQDVLTAEEYIIPSNDIVVKKDEVA